MSNDQDDLTQAEQDAVISMLRAECHTLGNQLGAIRSTLSAHGYNAYEVAMNPAGLVASALHAKTDHDWRDAFMAALTSGASVDHAQSIATAAAEVLARRRTKQ